MSEKTITDNLTKLRKDNEVKNELKNEVVKFLNKNMIMPYDENDEFTKVLDILGIEFKSPAKGWCLI